MTLGYLFLDAAGGCLPGDAGAQEWSGLRPRPFRGEIPSGATVIAVHRTSLRRLTARLFDLRAGLPGVPILALASRKEEALAAVKRSCLLAGADACAVLPDDNGWVGAQAVAMLRRASPAGAADSDEVSLNPGALSLRLDGRWYRLPPIDYALLQYLVHNEGTWVRARELAVSGALAYFEADASNLRWHIHQIRGRLREHAALLHNSRGLGYLFAREPCGFRDCVGCAKSRSGELEIGPRARPERSGALG